MKHIALAALALLGAPVAAFAGGTSIPLVEPPIVAPVMAAVQPNNWGGFYSGVALGYGRSFTTVPGQDGTMHIGGVYLGYRHEMGTVVFGGELSYDRDNIGVATADRSISHAAALKLTLGKDLGRTLVYGAIGVTRVNATLAGVTASDTGLSAGLGVDYALTQSWTVGGEVTFNHYRDFNNSGETLKDTALAIKVGYKF